MRRQAGVVDAASPWDAREELGEQHRRSRCAAPSGWAASWCRAAPATRPSARGWRPRRSARTAATRCGRRAPPPTTPPTLSLWPFRNFVVLWTTRSAPKSIGRCTYGLANVLSTTTATSRSWAICARGREVGEAQHRVGRRLEEQHLRVRAESPPRSAARSGRVDVGEVEPVLPQHALEQPVRAAVGVVGDHDVVAGLEQRHHGAGRRHARGERERGLAVLDGGDVALERRARRVLRARVFVALVTPECLLHVGRGLINRGDDGAGRRVRLLAGVDADGAEPRVVAQLHDGRAYSESN